MQTAFRASSGRSARGVHWGGQVPTWAKHLCAVCAAASSSGEHLRWLCGHLGLAETSGPPRRLHLAQLVLEGRQEMVGHVPAVQPHCRFSGRPAHCLHAGIGISCGSFASLCRGGANGTQSCLWLSARLCCLCRCRSSNKTYCFDTALDIPRYFRIEPASTRWTRYCDGFFCFTPGPSSSCAAAPSHRESGRSARWHASCAFIPKAISSACQSSFRLWFSLLRA